MLFVYMSRGARDLVAVAKTLIGVPFDTFLKRAQGVAFILRLQFYDTILIEK